MLSYLYFLGYVVNYTYTVRVKSGCLVIRVFKREIYIKWIYSESPLGFLQTN